jgi:hypothetical protein
MTSHIPCTSGGSKDFLPQGKTWTPEKPFVGQKPPEIPSLEDYKDLVEGETFRLVIL